MSDRVRLEFNMKQTTMQKKPLILDNRGTTRRPSLDQSMGLEKAPNLLQKFQAPTLNIDRHCLELLIQGRIQGQKTSKSWDFWASAKHEGRCSEHKKKPPLTVKQ